MTKLYLSGSTDRVKEITAGANKYIDLSLGYDESDYSKKINVRLNIPDVTKKPTLWITPSSDIGVGKTLMCEIDVKKPTELICKTY